MITVKYIMTDFNGCCSQTLVLEILILSVTKRGCFVFYYCLTIE